MSPSRYGDPDPQPVDDEPPESHHPRRRKGWIDRDGDPPVPCLQCKPHLAPGRRVHRIGE